MNRETENEELIELGVASTDTKGAIEGVNDFEGGLRPQPALNDD